MSIDGSFVKAALSVLWITGALLSVTSIQAGPSEPYQTPLFVSQSVPPLNLLVMGRDHKLYYEAYNDAFDLDGDGILDVGFKPSITYYGYFNSAVCYRHQNGRFEPTASAGAGNTCNNAWSGNFLNYLATSRMDALRKVLYGGYRSTDDAGETVLRAAFIPQDAHSSGKEYDPVRDNFAIGDYAPLSAPPTGFRHLFAVTTLSNADTPILRVLTNSSYRIWEWVSKEGPVASDKCVNNSTDCTSGGPNNWIIVPSSFFPRGLSITTWKDSQPDSPNNESEMNNLFNADSTSNRCGSGTVSNINTTGANNNPFTGNSHNRCSHNDYHTLITGTLRVPATGSYQFAVNGDDAVDFYVGSTRVAYWYGGHGANNSASSLASHSGSILLSAGTDYTIKFRHEEGTGDDNWQLWFRPPNDPTNSTLTDYDLKVLACPNDANLREDNCKAYSGSSGSLSYKPTGILHDFGENDSMKFGLLTGAYAKNTKGGVLRSNIDSFAREVNEETGQFRTDVSDGIVATLNKLRIVDFNSSYQYSNCGWIADVPITSKVDGVCSMWGNPLAEMMFEGLRYFAGASSGSSAYTYGSNARDTQSDLRLPAPGWKPPYVARASGGGGAQSCAVPVMTLISDINPSYDFTLPGSRFGTDSNTSLPTKISTLNVSSATDEIGTTEGINGKSYFIGQSNADNANSAPTAKIINNLSWARGLSPEEPSKQGTFYSAGIAKFAAENVVGGDKKMLTYSIALASPLPQITFPIGTDGNQSITLVPFAKSVGGGYSIDPTSNFQPTNQIVDYYVISIANTTGPGGADYKASVNGGRPYAQFRINYEDVEQGADHDMDAIALYTLSVEANGSLKVRLDSEYASGGIIQLMGYVISGTTADGIYLEVRDRDTNSEHPYKLNTPTGQRPGYCDNTTNLATDACRTLPLTAERTFTAILTTTAGFLKNPLWYAAKYGIPERAPSTVIGDPDNYFLVTNALTLKDQLTNAFNDIMQRNNSVTSPAVKPTTPQTADADFFVYRTDYDVETWSGDLIKETIDPNTGNRTSHWRAALGSRSGRTIKMADVAGKALVPLSWDNIRARGVNGIYSGVNLQQALATDPQGTDTPKVDAEGRLTVSADIARGQGHLDFVKGTNTSYRDRKSLLGDIINSSPVVVEGAQYLHYLAEAIEPGSNYAAFADTVKTRSTPLVFVGANDGMLHAFDTETGAEKFAFVPSAVIPNLNKLTSSDYNEAGGEHQFFVDGTPVVRDVYFDNQWHTVLVGTLRAGGKSIFALDITDPDDIRLLWELTEGDDLQDEETQSDVGYSFPVPTIARLHNGKWAVVTGNGYDSARGRAVLFLIDIKTGELTKIPTKDSDSLNGLSSVRVADDNSDGVADYVYAGDLKGNLWRFDLDPTGSKQDSAYTVSFGGSPLFAAKDGTGSSANTQAITAPPSVVRHPSMQGYILMFGTGRYFQLTDKETDKLDSLYGIWDRETKGASPNSTPSLSRDNLQQQTFITETSNTWSSGTSSQMTQNIRVLSNNSITWAQSSTDTNSERKFGWYLDLKVGNELKGERITDEMAARGQVLFFTTRTPSNDPCEAGLEGWTYGINPYTGGVTRFNVFDFDKNTMVNSGDSYNFNGTATVISGFKTPAGGISLSNNTLFTTDGSAVTVDFDPGAPGRQSWQIIPEDD
ncbi:type IV pilus assembly protein PilY1 [Azomonas agilis]|uniref:Type IV pilus assembly protein PilY1 n=1 Tax=Azomonas agilis TaxID=116849 RepID=A0A562I088_9GAMM|nr:PilC/PilY family type IV pilus protein [Azomonas agilis]TWH64055.1 type IV pilus assembly protein PilY1 [Azomonas agilis]